MATMIALVVIAGSVGIVLATEKLIAGVMRDQEVIDIRSHLCKTK